MNGHRDPVAIFSREINAAGNRKLLMCGPNDMQGTAHMPLGHFRNFLLGDAAIILQPGKPQAQNAGNHVLIMQVGFIVTDVG